MFYYFDMDGTICDFDAAIQLMLGMTVEDFGALPLEQKNAYKETLFTHDFFANLEPIRPMLDTLLSLRRAGRNVKILTATGLINVKEVKRGKTNWVRRHIGDIPIIFVDKVQHKGDILKTAMGGTHHLFDDRHKAIESWKAAQELNPAIKVSATFVSH